jgi:hypothetical protein
MRQNGKTAAMFDQVAAHQKQFPTANQVVVVCRRDFAESYAKPLAVSRGVDLARVRFATPTTLLNEIRGRYWSVFFDHHLPPPRPPQFWDALELIESRLKRKPGAK